MSKQNGKDKKVKRIAVNNYRRIALYTNPIVLVVLVLCLFFGAPIGVTIALGIIGYGIFFYFLVKANLEDRKIHGR